MKQTILGIIIAIIGAIYLGYALYWAWSPLLHIYFALGIVQIGRVIMKPD